MEVAGPKAVTLTIDLDHFDRTNQAMDLLICRTHRRLRSGEPKKKSGRGRFSTDPRPLLPFREVYADCQVNHEMIDLAIHSRVWEGHGMRYQRTTEISDRLASILDLIRKEDLSTRVLAERLGVSEPTINRDIEFLRSNGYEIKAVRVDQRWAYRVIESMLVRETDAGEGPNS
ncbi:HTH domain protein [Planctomycetes bacterium CA13]|uniref:HTH domain protein n=2 Tax=Novipirellula herctigrandis TaxID=2527986 RepID=A0A5C5Z2D3_9BACT|nr:HTH domain protein [Planctomycetes bacterium CA13]